MEFNIGHLPDGAYTIRLSGEEGILTKPLIVSEQSIYLENFFAKAVINHLEKIAAFTFRASRFVSHIHYSASPTSQVRSPFFHKNVCFSALILSYQNKNNSSIK